jgi:hypothetical protein
MAPRARASPREALRAEEIRRSLAGYLAESKRHARLAEHLTVDDVAALTQLINDFIAQPWSDADVKGLLRQDGEVRAYQAAIDNIGNLVQGILNRLEGGDRCRFHDATERFWEMLTQAQGLRPLLGEPRFKPRRKGGKTPSGRSLMAAFVADETLRALNRVGGRCGARSRIVSGQWTSGVGRWRPRCGIVQRGRREV